MMDYRDTPLPRLTYWMLTLLILGIGVYAIHLGIGENNDTEGMLLIAPKLLAGTYEPSRNWGAPFYEYLAAYTYHLFGLTTTNALSVAFTLGYLFFIDRIAQQVARSPSHGVLFMLAAVANPLVLINSTIMLEFMCAMFFFAGALYFGLRYLQLHKTSTLQLCAFMTAMLVLSRPDAAIFAVVFGIWMSAQSPKPSKTFINFAVFGLFAAGVYIYVNAGITFLVENFAPSIDPLTRRFAKAGISVINWLGLIGCFTLAGIFLASLKKRPAHNPYHLTRLIAVVIGLYLIRFILLPDELEYLLIPTVLLLLWLSYAFASWLPILGVTISLLLTNLMHVSVFEKTPDDHIQLSFHLNPGALVQDWGTRQVRLMHQDPAFIHYVLGHTLDNPETSASVPIHFPGIVSNHNDLIISQDKRYVFHNRGNLPQFDFKSYERVFICDESLYHPRGWRVMQAAPDTSILLKFSTKAPLHCEEYFDGKIS